MCESKCEIELVVGKTYKVCLKPFDELLSLGLVEGWYRDLDWYGDYLGLDVGLVTVPSRGEWGSVKVRWSNGKKFLYRLEELKVLGEV